MSMLEEIITLYDSKAAFCRKVGIKPQYLIQIENGRRPIPPKMAVALNKFHGVDLHSIRPDIYPESLNQAKEDVA
jgi:DNA-binding transcriptional regulator YdaS (Cro superfamily)